MKRHTPLFEKDEYDVVIVGGGIYGAAALREAARRGLSAALVEQDDFGAATSANSLKIIHGGLRYLQQLDVIRMRESIRERRTLLRTAPHLVHPLPCLMPTTRSLMKSRPAMFAALLANDVISWDRNRRADPARAIGRGHLISAAEVAKILPGWPVQAVTGGAVWYDACAYSTERIVLANVQSAVAAGASAVNHARVTGFLRRGEAVAGVRVRDALTNREFEIRARLVINNTGPWTDATLAMLGDRPAPVLKGLVFGMNLVLKGWPVQSYAVGLMSRPQANRSGRLLFFVPWKGFTLAGTYYRPHTGAPGQIEATEEDLERFLADINGVHPAARMTRDHITMIHAGLLPAKNAGPVNAGEPKLANHYTLVDHAARDGIEGLITVVGVKYTTARDVAARTIDLVRERLGQPAVRSSSAEQPLAGGEIENFMGFVASARESAPAGLAPDTLLHMLHHYGTGYRDVLAVAGNDPERLRPLCPTAGSTGAEVLHAVREEMAATLPDVVFRRTDLGTAALPDERVLRRCADLAGAELGWDETRKAQEIRQAATYPWRTSGT